MNNSEKHELSEVALKEFCKNFGENDDFKDVLFDVILELLYGNNISLPSETRQNSDPNAMQTRTGGMPSYTIE